MTQCAVVARRRSSSGMASDIGGAGWVSRHRTLAITTTSSTTPSPLCRMKSRSIEPCSRGGRDHRDPCRDLHEQEEHDQPMEEPGRRRRNGASPSRLRGKSGAREPYLRHEQPIDKHPHGHEPDHLKDTSSAGLPGASFTPTTPEPASGDEQRSGPPAHDAQFGHTLAQRYHLTEWRTKRNEDSLSSGKAGLFAWTDAARGTCALVTAVECLGLDRLEQLRSLGAPLRLVVNSPSR